MKKCRYISTGIFLFLLNQNHGNRETSNKHIGKNNRDKNQFIIFPELFAHNKNSGKDSRAKDNRENSKNKNKCCHFYFLNVYVISLKIAMVKIYHAKKNLLTLFLKKKKKKIWIVKGLTKSYFIVLVS